MRPDAGQLLQGVPPPVAAPRAAEPALEIEQPARPALAAPAGTRFHVAQLRITGATLFTEADLLALVKDGAGKEVSLADLAALADRITRHYRDSGYLVARAYLPAQEIRDGAVEIAVIEGRYGRIQLRKAEGLALGAAPLGGIAEGQPVATAPLERGLLLLSDTPGIEVKSTLTPGASVGTSDLLIDVAPGKPWSGSVDFDNLGNGYISPYRLGGAFYLNNPTGAGDLVSLRGLTSGPDYYYARLAYQRPVGSHGTQLGAAYSDMYYRLGREFEPLEANGAAQVASVYATHPFLRSRAANINGQLLYDEKRLRDSLDAFSSTTRKNLGVWSAGLSGDWRDGMLGGGANAWSATYSAGRLAIQSPLAQAVDSVTARTEGHYAKFAWSAMRLQTLTDSLSFYFAWSGQAASRNLDSSEKFSLGGAYGVRAYPQGEAASDEAQLVTAELRWLVAPGVQVAAFVDAARGTTNKESWPAATGPAVRELSGAGLGVTWTPEGGWNLRASYAARLSSSPATADTDRGGRFWLQLSKAF